MTGPHAEAHGNHIVLQFESLDDAMRLFNPWRGAAPRAQAAAQIHQALANAGLALSVEVKGRSVAELGYGKMSGPLVALLAPLAA
jgi:hypothetical protein